MRTYGPGHGGSERHAQTSLQGIAKKATEHRKYRFCNLYTMLNQEMLLDNRRFIRKEAAYGVDRVSAREHEQNLEANIQELVERLKRKAYRAKLVRRQCIPKGDGAERHLGIPTTEDKLLQLPVKRILEAIAEASVTEEPGAVVPHAGICARAVG